MKEKPDNSAIFLGGCMGCFTLFVLLGMTVNLYRSAKQDWTRSQRLVYTEATVVEWKHLQINTGDDNYYVWACDVSFENQEGEKVRRRLQMEFDEPEVEVGQPFPILYDPADDKHVKYSEDPNHWKATKYYAAALSVLLVTIVFFVRVFSAGGRQREANKRSALNKKLSKVGVAALVLSPLLLVALAVFMAPEPEAPPKPPATPDFKRDAWVNGLKPGMSRQDLDEMAKVLEKTKDWTRYSIEYKGEVTVYFKKDTLHHFFGDRLVQDDKVTFAPGQPQRFQPPTPEMFEKNGFPNYSGESDLRLAAVFSRAPRARPAFVEFHVYPAGLDDFVPAPRIGSPEGAGPLLEAVLGHRPEDVTRLLKEKPESWRFKTNRGKPLLALAIEKGYLQVAAALIDGGHSVDAVDDDHRTALFYTRDAKAIDLLASHEAKFRHKDLEGKTAFLLAVETGTPELLQVLLKNGSSYREKWDRQNALFMAARAGNFENVIFLRSLEKAYLKVRKGSRMSDTGGNETVTDKHGRSALHWAAAEGNPEMVFLLGTGVMARATAANGYSPLHEAVAHWDESRASDYATVVEMLVRLGADAEARGRADKTPLELAGEAKNQQALELLKKTAPYQGKGLMGAPKLIPKKYVCKECRRSIDHAENCSKKPALDPYELFAHSHMKLVTPP